MVMAAAQLAKSSLVTPALVERLPALTSASTSVQMASLSSVLTLSTAMTETRSMVMAAHPIAKSKLASPALVARLWDPIPAKKFAVTVLILASYHAMMETQ
jgi:hypothetical protein